MIKAIIIGIILTIISMAVLSGIDNGEQNNSTSKVQNNTSLVDEKTGEVKVSISGEVLYPGDYYLNNESTLLDLINAAGGLTSKADQNAFNSSAPINLHTSYYIAPSSEKESSCVETSISKVSINSGTSSELNSVGFTSTQSSAIVDHRKENGRFVCIEDIINVKGIGQGTFEKVKNKITL